MKSKHTLQTMIRQFSRPFSALAVCLLLAIATIGQAFALETGPGLELPQEASEPIPWSEIGVTAGAQYDGDGLAIVPMENGALLRCVFQRLEGEATAEGLWLTSTVADGVNDRFCAFCAFSRLIHQKLKKNDPAPLDFAPGTGGNANCQMKSKRHTEEKTKISAPEEREGHE